MRVSEPTPALLQGRWWDAGTGEGPGDPSTGMATAHLQLSETLRVRSPPKSHPDGSAVPLRGNLHLQEEGRAPFTAMRFVQKRSLSPLGARLRTGRSWGRGEGAPRWGCRPPAACTRVSLAWVFPSFLPCFSVWQVQKGLECRIPIPKGWRKAFRACV